MHAETCSLNILNSECEWDRLRIALTLLLKARLPLIVCKRSLYPTEFCILRSLGHMLNWMFSLVLAQWVRLLNKAFELLFFNEQILPWIELPFYLYEALSFLVARLQYTAELALPFLTAVSSQCAALLVTKIPDWVTSTPGKGQFASKACSTTWK